MAKYATFDVGDQIIMDTDKTKELWDGSTPNYQNDLYQSNKGQFFRVWGDLTDNSPIQADVLCEMEAAEWLVRHGFDIPADLQETADLMTV